MTKFFNKGTIKNTIYSFGTEFSDGRLTAKPDGRKYDAIAAYNLRQKLGRTLTDEEFEQFRK